VPAHFCGICGLKATPGRIPATGHFPPGAGAFSWIGVVGPMARTIADVRSLFEVMAGPDAGDALSAPARPPDLESGGDKLWRIQSGPDFARTQLLIADGHHRYETARTYADEIGGDGPHREVLMCLVSMSDPGLAIFPTHRVLPDLALEPDAMMTSNWDHDALAIYQRGNFFRVDSTDSRCSEVSLM